VLWLGLVFICIGIALLWISADPFVESAARLARIWGVSPLLVGALVVGFGTSAPELVVSALAAYRGELAESIGNAVGSNAANLSLVLGVSAVISAVVVRPGEARRLGGLTLAGMTALVVVVWDHTLDLWEGIFLVAGMAVAVFFLIAWTKPEPESEDTEAVSPTRPEPSGGVSVRALPEIGKTMLALIGITVGAWLLVEGGSQVADHYMLAGGFVGATIFALGTSLPELVTAMAAARRGETRLLIGNLLGSNLFNSLLVVGVAGVIGAGPIGERRTGEHLVMMLIVLVAGAMASTRSRLGRFEGVVLLGLFGLFIAVVAANATA